MQKGKHNIYSKEELLKLIKEGKTAPADMDEFDLEALEGLKLLDKHDVLDELNKEVDTIIIAEKKKEKKRRTIYYFSAAASLLLIIGLIFFFKNEVFIKNDKVVASAEKPKEEQTQIDLTAPTQQAETQATYEAKEPEERIKPKKEQSVLAENTVQTEKPDVSRLEPTKSIITKNNFSVNEKDFAKKQKTEEQVAFTKTETTVSDNEGNAANAQETNKPTANMAAPLAGIAADASYAKNTEEDKKVEQTPVATFETKKADQKSKTTLLYANTSTKTIPVKSFKEPYFIDGDSAFASYTKQHLKISSPGRSGIILVEFVVNKKGQAEKIKILKSIDNCDVCSKDVIDLIKSISNWQPAVMNGEVISASKKLNIRYN